MARLGISTKYDYSDPDRQDALIQDLIDEGVTPFMPAGDPAQMIVLLHEATGTLLEADILYRNAFAPPPGLICCAQKRTVEIADTPSNKAWRACVCDVSPNRCSPIYRFASFNENSLICQLGKPTSDFKVDRASFKHSLELLLGLPIKRVISAHDGQLDAHDWAEAVRAEYAWL